MPAPILIGQVLFGLTRLRIASEGIRGAALFIRGVGFRGFSGVTTGRDFGRFTVGVSRLDRALGLTTIPTREQILWSYRYTVKKRYIASITEALQGKDTKQGGRFAGSGLGGLNGIVQKSLKDASNNVQLTTRVDTSNYDRALKDYMNNTRKSVTEVVNQKAYWIAINAIKETYKANKSDIKSELEKPSDKMPGLTVAEAMVVYRNNKANKRKMTRGEIRKEARALINKRTRAIGFLKSGWIPAVKVLAPHVKRRLSVGNQANQKGKDKGGAKPASRASFTTNVVATIWNSIEADNNPRARNYMQVGLQRALDTEARSMLAYVEEKMRKNAEKFNRA